MLNVEMWFLQHQLFYCCAADAGVEMSMEFNFRQSLMELHHNLYSYDDDDIKYSAVKNVPITSIFFYYFHSFWLWEKLVVTLILVLDVSVEEEILEVAILSIASLDLVQSLQFVTGTV